MSYDGTLVLEYLRKTHETSLLTEREKHLVGLAVTMTRGCQVCARNRIEKARAAGIGDDLLTPRVGVAAAASAGGSAAAARGGSRPAAAAEKPPCAALCAAEPRR